MRNSLILALFLFLPAMVQAAPSEADKLFAQLKKVETAEEARPIEKKLSGLFRISGSPSVDLLMARAQMALGSDSKAARKIVDSVTSIAPRFAEGWRARAQMQQAAGDDAGAMLSLQKTVTLNPRHFEALTDLGDMLEQYGDKAGALKLYRQALAVDPHLAGAARAEKALAKELEGQGI